MLKFINTYLWFIKMLCTKLFLILVIYDDNFRNIFPLLEYYFILSKYIIHHLIASPHVDWHDAEMRKERINILPHVSLCSKTLSSQSPWGPVWSLARTPPSRSPPPKIVDAYSYSWKCSADGWHCREDRRVREGQGIKEKEKKVNCIYLPC